MATTTLESRAFDLPVDRGYGGLVDAIWHHRSAIPNSDWYGHRRRFRAGSDTKIALIRMRRDTDGCYLYQPDFNGDDGPRFMGLPIEFTHDEAMKGRLILEVDGA